MTEPSDDADTVSDTWGVLVAMLFSASLVGVTFLAAYHPAWAWAVIVVLALVTFLGGGSTVLGGLFD